MCWWAVVRKNWDRGTLENDLEGICHPGTPGTRFSRPWSSPVPNISSANKLRPTPDTQGIRCVYDRCRRWFHSNRVHGDVDIPKEISAKSTDSLPRSSVPSAMSTGSYLVSF